MLDFKQLLQRNTLLLAYFHADWCMPCQTMLPIFNELATTINAGTQAHLVEINVDGQRYLAKQYQVQRVPTFVLFRNGVMCWRHTGILAAHYLEEVLEQYATRDKQL